MNLMVYALAGLATIIIAFPVMTISTKYMSYIAAMLFILAGISLVETVYFFSMKLFGVLAWWFLGIAIVCTVGGVLILKRKKKKEQ